MTAERNHQPLSADVVIAVYNERPEALTQTVAACLNQSYSVSRIFVVDDGSAEPLRLPAVTQPSSEIRVARLPQNAGISAARNAGIALSTAPLVACINTQVLPDLDWLAVCKDYLCQHPNVGAVYTRLVSTTPKRILSQWRMRFLETRFGEQSGPTPFAPGHAVLFRRQAIDSVGGYDARFRRHHEDSDICFRMQKKGWETHYVAQSRCVSTQEDSFEQMVTKELRESYWYSPEQSALLTMFWKLSERTALHAGRNLLRGRWHFLPIDAAIWAAALWRATSHTIRFWRATPGRKRDISPSAPNVD